MLTELRIKNFAIIESLTLPLARGFNVLSGETGAGKSIIVGALGLLLGERASADLIRTGTDRASVEGVFDTTDRPDLARLLDERGVEVEEQTVVLKREIAAGGRARAWINGTTVTAGVLAEVGRLLVNLHGQHEAQTLLDGDSQRRILDAFGGATAQAERVRTAADTLHTLRDEMRTLARRRAEAERRADYLRHVVQEIEGARLTIGEDDRLEEEARRLEHAEELRSLAGGAHELLEGSEDAVLAALAQLHKALGSLQRIDPSLGRLQELYDGAFYSLEELSRELEEYEGRVELDPDRLEEVQRRRDLLFRLCKKYGPGLGEVIETGRTAREELDLVDSAGFDLKSLEQREAAAREELVAEAATLSEMRRAAAERLSAAVEAVLPDLGMADGRLRVELPPRGEPAATGAEDVEFRVALNLGHDARPLARVASGGELSRVMLALKTILARLDGVPTLVFDEVDAGIGGRVGLMVGETMRRVAQHHQVFAISHLPQLAARAHHHILVAKGAKGGVTTADVRVLAGDERVVEVARMLGGDPESQVSRAHARELLDTAAVDTAKLQKPAAPEPSLAAAAPRRRR
ncbi:DNA repair protein RecN [Gemmatirosa kalamazoonensis]|uniref:DNA repair protein RecN n=1 Tax=Gemmatirosa kalamazoonensis TaxID=861299 RepID=W0RJL4_9BACT|nr:DNA repair protein RecN [Gemmatirosa kalamazoonensis]AHG90971.1 DNA repair protein RecN [Gemmatirosa kalamazoonensis]